MLGSVLVFGTFDVLHPGHVWFLKRAADYGAVTVSLTPDKLCQHYKGRLPNNPFAIRRARLLNLFYVSKVIAADNEPYSFATIDRTVPTYIILGYDQIALSNPIRRHLKVHKLTAKVVFLGRYQTHFYHSSYFRVAAMSGGVKFLTNC